MTMINPEPIKLTPTMIHPSPLESQTQFTLDYVESIKADRERLATSRDSYIERANKAEATIRKILNGIEIYIREHDFTRDSDDAIPVDIIDDLFSSLGLDLSFKKTYEVLVEYKLHARFKIEADSEDDAIAECEQQGIDSIDFDMYAEEEWEEQERNVIEAVLEEA